MSLTFDTIVSDIKENKLKHIKNIDDLINHKQRVEKYIPMIYESSNTENEKEILTKSSSDRYVIYKLCDIMKFKYERIQVHGTRHFECCDFSGPDSNPYTGCGCPHVPKKNKKV